MSTLEMEPSAEQGSQQRPGLLRRMAGMAFNQMSPDVPAYRPDHWDEGALSLTHGPDNYAGVTEGRHPYWLGFDVDGASK